MKSLPLTLFGRLKVTSSPGGKVFDVAPSEDLFLAASGPPIEDPVWAQSPHDASAGLFAADRTFRTHLSGAMTARCVTTGSGALVNCWIQTENPPGQIFGEALLRTLEHARLQPLTATGAPDAGRPLTAAIRYELGK